jgi:hypothetical protein
MGRESSRSAWPTVRPQAASKAGAKALAVGEKAPEFSLRSHRDQQVRLADFLGERHVLLFFVRGDWCPGWHIMLRTYQQHRHEFDAKNTGQSRNDRGAAAAVVRA